MKLMMITMVMVELMAMKSTKAATTKLVTKTMVMAELMAMQSTEAATTVSLAMIPTLRMTTLVSLKTWGLFQLQ